MAAKTTKTAASTKPAPKEATPEDRRWAARRMVDGTACAAVTVGYLGGIGAGAADAHDLRSFVADTVREVAAGDLSALEKMLLQQSVTLQAIFADLAFKAKAQTSRDNLHTLTTLALKAAAGSRQAIVALAELRAPKSVMFARQANVTSGPQQVNNGTVASALPARAEEMQNRPNELLEVQHGNHLDSRAAGAAGRADRHLETVDAGHRASHA